MLELKGNWKLFIFLFPSPHFLTSVGLWSSIRSKNPEASIFFVADLALAEILSVEGWEL